MSVAPVAIATASALPLVEELTPAPDPWDVARRLARLPHLVFFDSADRHAERGRFSYVAADPVEWIVDSTRDPRSLDPFAELARRLAAFPLETLPELPPFQGGVAGQFGYGLQHAIERIPRPRFDEFRVPDLAVGIYDWVIAFDHRVDRAWLISTGYPDNRSGRAARRLKEVHAALRGDRLPGRPSWTDHRVIPTAEQFPLAGRPGVTSNFSRMSYLTTVRRAIEYVNAGDCFQVNLAQRLLTRQTEHPLELYGRLRERNPAPFAGYFDLGDFAIASASPERFVRVTDGDVETRPIKGTRPRGRTLEEERTRIADLVASPKDRAENVMIVDLLRNDLGRVCQYGSVRVPRVCQVETYKYVHHLVSEVRGRLAEGKGPLDLLRACFPGGSVTGAPKVRAMEIIAELEPTARGPYCGSLGFIGFDGSMDTNILIRSFTAGKGWLQFPVGGGIVADSEPEREYEETLHKAEGLLRALELNR
ncbi:MAG TPA: aminodeoxychorismate synthase component I [Gemmataceae bacterium]|jgi:para-aminobenzoate synthetase component 1|nr:aminodeoxychorismate synthase component I [Gemmataceae bacterium]